MQKRLVNFEKRLLLNMEKYPRVGEVNNIAPIAMESPQLQPSFLKHSKRGLAMESGTKSQFEFLGAASKKNKNGLNVLLLFMLLCFSVNLWAQEISGTITDGDEPLIGATIIIQNTTIGTTTDLDGKYKITANNLTDTLVVSYLGYENLEVPIVGRSTIDVDLSRQIKQLDEVIVVGYGRQKKREVTGAISRVSDEEITAAPTLRVEQALQGRTSGVQVSNQSGQPGDEPTVRVRGIGTTGNAKPLYIVDGLAVGGIDYLNPGDIETIDILKDAASSAIYGARAANGVVLITTKSGEAGKLSISYDTYYGLQNTANKLNMLNADEYKMIMNEGARNADLSEPFDLNEISTYDTDWQHALFVKNAPIQNHQISVNGGNDKSTFSSSLSYFSQEGIIGGDKSQFDRYTARLNSTHQINKWMNFGNNFAYTHLIKRGIATNASFNGVYSSALNMSPLTPVIESDEDVLNTYPYNAEPVVRDTAGNVYGISEELKQGEVLNPLALLETNNAETRKDQFVGNIFGELEPVEGLKFKSSLGIDLAYLLDDGFRPLFFLNGSQSNIEKTSVNKHIQRFFTWQWENTLAYEKQINGHKVNLLAGLTASEFKYEDLFGFNAKVPVNDPKHVYLNQAIDTVGIARGGAGHSALYSQFGRINYSYNNKYSLTAILRRDGSSKFGANSRYGIFPSIGLAWVLSDEVFMQNNLGPVNYLKLRASWGINGNQEIGDYQFLSTINDSRGYTFGSGREVGSSPLFLENADIHWEESVQFNIGVDAGLFENRMDITVDYYIKETKDLLEKIPIPAHVGNDGPVANVGSVQNKGIEASINWRNKTKAGLKYNLGGNASYNKNKMTKIANPQGTIEGAGWAVGGAVTRSEVGLPIAYFWGYQTDGIFQNQNEVFGHINLDGEVLQPNAVPGDVRFVDVNADGTINDNDRTFLGNPTPEFFYGFNGGIEYKNIEFSFFLQGIAGNSIFNGSQRQDLRYTNRTTAILERWTGEETSNSTPRYSWIDLNNNYRVSDLYIEKGSYMRLKNMQLGYNLPVNLLNKLRVQAWRIYISGENLLTLTPYTGADPEIGTFTYNDESTGELMGTFDIGIDRGIYPQARTVRIGTSITF